MLNQCRDFRRADWCVRATPLAECAAMVREHHYAKGCSNTAVYSHGLYRVSDGRLSGAALYLPPTRAAAETVDRQDWRRVVSLSRLVVLPDVPQNGASFLMAASLRLVKKEGKWSWVVTYADQSQGHTGAIYKATNWEYRGVTTPTDRWLDSGGKQVARKCAGHSRTRAEMAALGYRLDGYYAKHKFVLKL